MGTCHKIERKKLFCMQYVTNIIDIKRVLYFFFIKKYILYISTPCIYNFFLYCAQTNRPRINDHVKNAYKVYYGLFIFKLSVYLFHYFDYRFI